MMLYWLFGKGAHFLPFSKLRLIKSHQLLQVMA